MATTKVKGTSAKIKELTGTNPEKITNEQLEKVQKTVNSVNRIQLEIGNLEVKKHEMMHQVSGLRENLAILQGEFEKDYGTFDINIQDGTINYPENGEADKKD